MRCVVMADQRCREEVCDAAPVSEQVICQTRCLDYAQSSQTAAATAFTDSMQSECSDFQRNQSSGQNITAGLGAGIPSECVEAATRQLQLFNALAQQQQVYWPPNYALPCFHVVVVFLGGLGFPVSCRGNRGFPIEGQRN